MKVAPPPSTKDKSINKGKHIGKHARVADANISQDINLPKQKTSYKKQNKGMSKIVMIVLLAILLVLISAIYFIFFGGYKTTLKKDLAWEQFDTYPVPDGLLQSAEPENDYTEVIYLFDVADNEEPYAVEQHAVLSYDFFGEEEKIDIGEEVDKKSGHVKTEDIISSYGNVQHNVDSPAEKAIRIEVHLPEEAREYVSTLYNK